MPRSCAGQAGIVERTLDNSAAYVAGWLERLKSDARLVVMTVAAQAQKAADYVLGVVPQGGAEAGKRGRAVNATLDLFPVAAPVPPSLPVAPVVQPVKRQQVGA